MSTLVSGPRVGTWRETTGSKYQHSCIRCQWDLH